MKQHAEKDGSDGQEDRRCRKGRTGFPVMISQSGHLNYLAASDVACGASFVAPQVVQTSLSMTVSS